MLFDSSALARETGGSTRFTSTRFRARYFTTTARSEGVDGRCSCRFADRGRERHRALDNLRTTGRNKATIRQAKTDQYNNAIAERGADERPRSMNPTSTRVRGRATTGVGVCDTEGGRQGCPAELKRGS